ncbi:MAG: hypothetical protein AB2693_26990 [Candidatus Thiodiazotropha sp.]
MNSSFPMTLYIATPQIIDNLLIIILGIASFAPKELGAYQCQIFRDEKHIKGSPFTINVTDKELAHAAKVHVTGQTAEAKANQPNYVSIDTSGTGKLTRFYDTLLNVCLVRVSLH